MVFTIKTIILMVLITLGTMNSSVAAKAELTEKGFAEYVIKLKAEA